MEHGETIVRYPNELFLEERHVQEALKYASEIVEWAQKMVEQKQGG